MKNQIFVTIFLIAALSGFISCGKKDAKEKSYPQHLVNALDKADAVAVGGQAQAIKNALNSFYLEHDEYPAGLDDLLPGYLQVETELIDPWGVKFRIENQQIISAGKDKNFGTADDLAYDF